MFQIFIDNIFLYFESRLKIDIILNKVFSLNSCPTHWAGCNLFTTIKACSYMFTWIKNNLSFLSITNRTINVQYIFFLTLIITF